MAITVRQRVDPDGAAFHSFPGSCLADSLVLAIGVRRDASGVAIANPGSFTDLGQPLQNTDSNPGRAFAQVRVAGAIGTGPVSFGDGGRYVFGIYELVGADINNLAVLAPSEQGFGAANATLDLGNFAAARGKAFMAQCMGGGGISDQYYQNFITMGAAWTELYDGRMDPSEHGSRPWVGIGEASPSGADLNPSWDWSTPSNVWGNGVGIAVLFKAPGAGSSIPGIIG